MRRLITLLFCLTSLPAFPVTQAELQAACNLIEPFSPVVKANQRPICACVSKNIALSISQENMAILLTYYRREITSQTLTTEHERLANWELAITMACIEDHDYTWEDKGRNPDGKGYWTKDKPEDPIFPKEPKKEK